MLSSGVITYDGVTKIRITATPCLFNCKVCADGFRRNKENNQCYDLQNCPSPYIKTIEAITGVNFKHFWLKIVF